jgi:protein-disulfide isomerase
MSILCYDVNCEPWRIHLRFGKESIIVNKKELSMRYLSIFFLSLLCAGPAFAAAERPVAEKPAIQKTGVEKPVILKDHALGDDKAKLTIIEYASLTCIHCAHFHEKVLPDFIKKYVDTGKIKYIFRDYPLNAPAVKAAALAYCMPEDRYYPFIKTLYQMRDAWWELPDPSAQLTQYAGLAGLASEKAQTCLNDTKVQEAIVARRSEAETKYKITGTPSFVFNDGKDVVTGIGTLEELEKTIQKYEK